MKVRELLTDESKWYKGYFARDENGIHVQFESESACKFCLSGAIRKCYTDINGSIIGAKVYKHIRGSIPCWNDAPERTFAEVKQLVEELDI